VLKSILHWRSRAGAYRSCGRVEEGADSLRNRLLPRALKRGCAMTSAWACALSDGSTWRKGLSRTKSRAQRVARGRALSSLRRMHAV